MSHPMHMEGGVKEIKGYPITPADEERFWAKVDTSGDCWTWTASTIDDGYGMFRMGGKYGKLVLSHRFAYTVANGTIPPGVEVEHACRNPPCCRSGPGHLREATHKQNMENLVARGLTGVRGLTRDGDRWRGVVVHNYRYYRKSSKDRAVVERWLIDTRRELFTHSQENR